MNEKKIINVGIDIETLSTKPTAAIISIAAKSFDLGDEHVSESSIVINVNATSCAISGYDIDPETCKWWTDKDVEVKTGLLQKACTIHEALTQLTIWISNLKKNESADEVIVWTQGSDFDLAILRNAYSKEFPEKSRDATPWKYTNARCARTYVLEGLKLLFGYSDKPYSNIPNDGQEYKAHDPLSDISRTISNIQFVHNSLNFKVNEEKI